LRNAHRGALRLAWLSLNEWRRFADPEQVAYFISGDCMVFQDRSDAGRVLARALEAWRSRADTIVLGLPRGGVPVAYEVACALNLPLDIFVVRKLGVPGQRELAMGAIASGGMVAINQKVVEQMGISRAVIEAVIERENLEIARREQVYRDGRAPACLEGLTTIVIDDGLATGASMLAAVRALRSRARRVIAAVPVAAESSCNDLKSEVDEIICATMPNPFPAVGNFYRNFDQTSDDEVRALLSHAERNAGTVFPSKSEPTK
jgi:predicted phosphoribosyltransferase